MLPYLRLSALCLLSCLGSCQAQKDLTLEPEASGAEVVQAVVAKIETSGIFPTDNRLLRRIAYVESKDGTDSATCQRGYCGGIWQVDEFGFHDTQNTTSNPDLVDSHHAIAVQFGITWSTVEMGELLKPFYSGLAARLRLASVLEKIPLSSDIAAQAAYWKQHYSSEFTNETLQKFEDDVGVLEGIEGCQVYSDIVFVLDSSGSIGSANYEEVRNFVYNFASGITIGPKANQVGVIIYGETYIIEFSLSTYKSEAPLLQAVKDIPYPGGSTNTGDALRAMAEIGFSKESGARSDDDSVFRIAIVMTDGKANTGEPVANASAAVHATQPPILVYAIGVGDGVNLDELNLIATGPKFVDQLESFDPELLKQSQEQRAYQICFKASVPTDIKQNVSGTLDQGQEVRYQYSIPEEGITIYINVDDGHVVLYASSAVPTPNEAYYDYKLDCLDSCELFVNPEKLSPSLGSPDTGRLRRANDNSTVPTLTNFTLYLSIEGVETNSTFEIQSNAGDTTTPDSVQAQDEDDDNSHWIFIGASAGGGFILILVVILALCFCVLRSYRKRKARDRGYMYNRVRSDSTEIYVT